MLAGIYVLAIAARIGSGTISDRLGSRLRPLRTIGVALAVATACVAVAVDAPLALVVPLFVVAGVLSMSWNGLAYAAAAEAAGAARTGAALGFQQTLLGVVVAGAPPVVAASPPHSWRLAFFLAAAGPAVGVVILRRLRERAQVGDPREHAERRRPCRQLAELRIEAAELVSRCENVDCTAASHIGSGPRSARTAPNPSRVRSAAASISTSISASNTFCRQPMYVCPCSSYA